MPLQPTYACTLCGNPWATHCMETCTAGPRHVWATIAWAPMVRRVSCATCSRQPRVDGSLDCGDCNARHAETEA